MKNTVLASLATISLGAGLLLLPGIASAASLEASEEELTAVMGPAQEYQRGLSVNGVAPTLRSVVVGEESILAYCIEYWIRAADPDHESAVTGWDEFTGDNNFKTDPQVRHSVAWILRHSYPTLSLEQVAQQTGAVGLSEAEVISATQAAIWHFTDDFVPDKELLVEDAPDGTARTTDQSAANVQAVFDYLTGSDNTGLTEQEVQASVTLEDATDPDASIPEPVASGMTSEADHVFGPILLNASTDEVELAMRPIDARVEADQITVVTSEGEPLDLAEPVSAEEVWVHVPADLETGAVRLAAESVEYGYTGRLIIPEPDGQRRFQTIVVVDQTTDSAATELELTWEKTVVEKPDSPAESPLEDAPPVEEPREETQPIKAQVENTSPSEAPPLLSEEPVAVQENSSVAAVETERPTPTQDNLEKKASTQEAVETKPAAELATTGAQQTRNVLVALGTVAVGACLMVVNRFRRSRT